MLLVLKMATPTPQEFVCSADREERVCNNCATYISHTVLHGTTQASELVCKMHFFKLVASSGGGQQRSLGLLESKL
jgi:hypothetical protein